MDVLLRLLNSLLMLAIPLALAAWAVRHYRLEWRIFLIGAGTFAGAQLLEVPFNRLLLQPLLGRLGIAGASHGWGLFWLGIIFGLVAGLFEEGARYVVYRRWLGDVRTWAGGQLFGIGHGGMEAIMLGALSFYVLLQTIAYRNADLATLVPPEQLPLAQAQLDAYWSAPWYAALLGALERIFALGIQMSLAVIVLQTFLRRNHVWLVVAIAWHMVVDATAVFSASTWGIYITEVLVGLMAAASVWGMYQLKGDEIAMAEVPATRVDDDIPPVVTGALVDDPPEDLLEESRYNSG
jgi:uncharacterized membrane protein YhfC